MSEVLRVSASFEFRRKSMSQQSPVSKIVLTRKNYLGNVVPLKKNRDLSSRNAVLRPVRWQSFFLFPKLTYSPSFSENSSNTDLFSAPERIASWHLGDGDDVCNSLVSPTLTRLISFWVSSPGCSQTRFSQNVHVVVLFRSLCLFRENVRHGLHSYHVQRGRVSGVTTPWVTTLLPPWPFRWLSVFPCRGSDSDDVCAPVRKPFPWGCFAAWGFWSQKHEPAAGLRICYKVAIFFQCVACYKVASEEDLK